MTQAVALKKFQCFYHIVPLYPSFNRGSLGMPLRVRESLVDYWSVQAERYSTCSRL